MADDDKNKPDELEDKPIESTGPVESDDSNNDSDELAKSIESIQESAPAQESPADALSRTPDELEEEAAASGIEKTDEPVKKDSAIRRLFRRLNIYFLIFVLLLIVAIIIVVVNYLNSQKIAPEPNVATQQLTQEALQQLANTDATVGGASQTLTIQGNAVIDGQTLMRGNLNIAGNLQTGGSIQGPDITISGTSNLGTAQINSLQVAQNTAIQGSTTMRDLNVSGTSSFGGAMTASQITVTKLILSGAGELQIPNHVTFTGSTPSRTTGNGLGTGGSVSINGSDTSGTINVNTGNGPSTGCFAQINFVQRYTGTPRVIVSPVGSAAGQTQYYVTRTATGFSLCTAAPAPANQSFAFDYFVMG